MKKLKILGLLLLAVLMMPFVASCGGNENEEDESEYRKFIRLANFKEENYDFPHMGEISDSYMVFYAFEKDTEIFHIWLFNRINNKIVEYKKQIKKSYQLYEGYGEYVDYQLNKLNRKFVKEETKVGSLLLFTLGYSNSTGDHFGCIEISYLLNGNENLVLLNESDFQVGRNYDNGGYYIKQDWYNNSLAFQLIKTNEDKKQSYVTVIVNQDGQVVKTLNCGFHYLFDEGCSFVEFYDYDRALFWGARLKDITYSEDNLMIYFLDLNKEVKYYYNRGLGAIFQGGFGIPFSDFALYNEPLNCKYNTDIISSDNRYCTFRITEINYQGEKKEVVVRADKQTETAEIVK